MQGGEGDDENDVLFKFILVGDAGIFHVLSSSSNDSRCW